MGAAVNGEIVRAEQSAITRPAPREVRVVEDTSAVANIMDTARFEHLQRVATLMANSSLLPNHLRYVKGKESNAELPAAVQAANCFRVVNQALRWGFDPFAIVDETYMVGGKLGYQGKLVAAVINARAGLSGRLRYEFSGKGEDRTVTVIGQFKGEDEDRYVDLRLGDARTDNQMWRKDPDQKLIYSGVVKWARRHCPEVVMGVITDDDLERMAQRDERPAGHNLNDRLRLVQHEHEEAREGAGGAEVNTTTGEVIERQSEPEPDPKTPSKPVTIDPPATGNNSAGVPNGEPDASETRSTLSESAEGGDGNQQQESPKPAQREFKGFPEFEAAAREIAIKDGLSTAEFEQSMKVIRAGRHSNVISTRTSVGVPERSKVYAAMEAGAFNWKTATIDD